MIDLMLAILIIGFVLRFVFSAIKFILKLLIIFIGIAALILLFA